MNINTNLFLLLLLPALSLAQVKFEPVPMPGQKGVITNFEAKRSTTFAHADIDNDGDADFILNGGGYLNPPTELYINQGPGKPFKRFNPQSIPDNSDEAAFFDADGDGDQDLIITGLQDSWFNQQNYETKLFLNDGRGNFSEDRSNAFQGMQKSTILTADFNGDGAIDVFVKGQDHFLVTYSYLYLNDGSGQFSLETNTGLTALHSGDAAASDVDGDGNLDLLLSGIKNSGQKACELFINNGSGIFSPSSQNNSFDQQDLEMEMGDIDGDGYPDLLTYQLSSTSSNNKLYKNNGSGKFNVVTSNPIPNYDDADAVFIDIDKDSDIDIVTTGLISGGQVYRVAVCRNNGNWQFNVSANNNMQGVENGLIDAVDVEGDKDQDLMITGNYSEGPKFVGLGQLNLNDGTGSFSPAASIDHFEGALFTDHDFGDVNGDGYPDLIIGGNRNHTNQPNPYCQLYLNDSTGRFRKATGSSFKAMKDLVFLKFADIDNDNDLDLLQSGKDGNQKYTRTYTNDGNGNFSFQSNIIATPKLCSFATADIDGDQDTDLMLSGVDNDFSHLYKNDGSGNFTLWDDTTFTQVRNSFAIFEDVDGDSDYDLLLTGASQGVNKTTLYLNDGSGQFSRDNRSSFIQVNRASADFADVDGDNDADLMISGAQRQGSSSFTDVALYKNDGTGSFSILQGQPFLGTFNGNIQFSDVDGDGDPDLLESGREGNDGVNRIYKNDGFGNFEVMIDDCLDDTYKGSCGMTDLNLDGYPDIVITGVRERDQMPIAKLYHNKSCNLDTAVIRQSPSELVSQYNGLDFQWMRCDTALIPVPGANHPTFKPKASGSYAVVVYDGCCSDTSGCYPVNTVGIDELAGPQSGGFTLYPNPATHKFQIDLGKQRYSRAQVQVFDAVGKLMYQKSAITEAVQEVVLPNHQGLCIVKVNYADGSSESRKLLMQ